MNQERPLKTAFLLAVTGALLVPLLVQGFVSHSAPGKKTPIPYQLGRWTGEDLQVSDDILKNYTPLEVRATWRRYRAPGQRMVGCLVQEASNYENLHDSFACLVFGGTCPRRIGLVHLDCSGTPPASLLEYTWKGKPWYVLFCYQSKAGPANYPPSGLSEHVRLNAIGRLPCRLVQVYTRIADNRTAAIARLKEVAGGICMHSL